MYALPRWAIVGLLLILVPLVLAPVQPLVARSPFAAPGDSVFGVNSHSASRHGELATMNQSVDAVVNAGAGWVREDFQWFRIEPRPGEFDWSFHDEMVQLYRAQGVQIIGLLNGPTPGWSVPGNPGTDFFAPDPQGFANFARAAVERYAGQITYWEVWNEPENALYWKPTPDSVAYTNLLRTVAPAIRAANPNARILVAGLVTPQPGQDFLQAIYDNGGWNDFDIISIHPYVDPATPEAGQIAAAGVGAIRSLADRLGSKPIWATEFGWSTGPGGRGGVAASEEEQANYLVRGAVLLRAAEVERVLWYNLKDSDGGPQRYGIFGYAGSRDSYTQPKPAYQAFTTLNEQLAATTPRGMLELGQRETILDFENFGVWQRGDQPYGTFVQSSEQRRNGSFSGKLSYNFPTASNDFVVFLPQNPPTIGANSSPSQLGLWVYGDSSGHSLRVWLRDAAGEILQFRVGVVGPPGWQLLTTPVAGPVEPFNKINDVPGNLQLDFPATLYAIVLDDEPNEASGSGVIYLDDMEVSSGPEAYGARFDKGDGTVVDVLWSTDGGPVAVPTGSNQATLVDRWGGTSTPTAQNGSFTFNLGPSPIYLNHTPAGSNLPPPPPPPPPPAPAPGGETCFEPDKTQHCIGGNIGTFWQGNGGLSVFGFPVTPSPQEGTSLVAQWFERNRLEWHPQEPATSPYRVQLGRLGAERLEQLGRDPFAEGRESGPQPGCLWFEETGHNVCNQQGNLGFRSYWEGNGLTDQRLNMDAYQRSLALFGLPLTAAREEVSATDGNTYITQWFERARFEWHPENPDNFKVLLGLLGNEIRSNQ